MTRKPSLICLTQYLVGEVMISYKKQGAVRSLASQLQQKYSWKRSELKADKVMTKSLKQFWMVLIGAFMLAACGFEAPSGEGQSETPSADNAVSMTVSDQADAENKVGVWSDIIWGDADAPVTVTEYASMTCPHCANFSNTVFPKLDEEYIKTGKVRLRFRNYIFNRLDMYATITARCGDMETAKHLIKVIFARQQKWGTSEDPTGELGAIARRAGISRTQLDKCIVNRPLNMHLANLTKTYSQVEKIRSTPTLLVNGIAIEGSSWEALKKAIDAQL